MHVTENASMMIWVKIIPIQSVEMVFAIITCNKKCSACMSNKNHCARLWMEKVESSVTGVKNNCIPGVQFAFNSDLSICLRVGYAISCTKKF